MENADKHHPTKLMSYNTMYMEEENQTSAFPQCLQFLMSGTCMNK